MYVAGNCNIEYTSVMSATGDGTNLSVPSAGQRQYLHFSIFRDPECWSGLGE